MIYQYKLTMATMIAILTTLSPAKVYECEITTPIYSYRIINTYPHDSQAFTQGLIYQNGFLYESTGLHGQSSLRQVELETGRVRKIHSLKNSYFGEGMTLWQDKLIQLTWQSQIGFVYHQKTFEQLNSFTYNTEGWGITHDGEQLIMSDGSDKLYFMNANTFEIISHLQVRDKNTPIFRLNELEYIQGEIFANVWRTHYIARISPRTGQVLGWINLRGLMNEFEKPPKNVLNGIAYDKAGKRLFVTGKLWPKLFEIELVN